MLKIENLHTYYGAIEVLHGISITVNDSELVCVIGANGAGKTTLMHSIVGLTTQKSGRINFMGNDITSLPAYKITRRGISLVPEERQLFNDLTVMENLIMGAYSRKKDEMQQSFSFVFDLFPRLAERRRQQAGTLSGGEQQMLAIARALMSKPKLLLLDEPSLGLAPLLLNYIFKSINQLKKNCLTILLVEQNANMALSIASRGYVMSTGHFKLEGTSEELMRNPDVQVAYLGKRGEEKKNNEHN